MSIERSSACTWMIDDWSSGGDDADVAVALLLRVGRACTYDSSLSSFASKSHDVYKSPKT